MTPVTRLFRFMRLGWTERLTENQTRAAVRLADFEAEGLDDCTAAHFVRLEMAMRAVGLAVLGINPPEERP